MVENAQEKKYVLKWQDLQLGDIIIDREDSNESRNIRKATKSDYSHARIYVGGTVMEANGIAVQSVNPQRIVYDNDNDVVVLRCAKANKKQLLKACVYARSEFGKEYSFRKLANTQYCFRLVAEAFHYADINIVKNPARCTANDFLNSSELNQISDMTRIARQRDLEIAYGDGVMKDKGHYNELSETAADMFAKVRQYIAEHSGKDTDIIQNDGTLFEYLIAHSEYDVGVADILRKQPYFELWKKHEETHPWEFDAEKLIVEAGAHSKKVARQILDSCNDITAQGWKYMYDIMCYFRDTYYLETAKVYVDLYKNLIEMTARRERVARTILGL